MNQIVMNTINGAKQDLLQEGRRIARLKQTTAYCLIRGKCFGYVTTRQEIAELRITQGYKLYAKINAEGNLIL